MLAFGLVLALAVAGGPLGPAAAQDAGAQDAGAQDAGAQDAGAQTPQAPQSAQDGQGSTPQAAQDGAAGVPSGSAPQSATAPDGANAAGAGGSGTRGEAASGRPGAASGLPLDPNADVPALGSSERVGDTAAADTSFPEWERLAARAEEVIYQGRASNSALEVLRGDLVTWRSKFQDLQTANASRIAALRDQIAALGPAPQDGATEAQDITVRRAELERQLARLEAPRRAADEAYSRADALIRQIDAMIRARQANELLTLGPSPLNPAHWPGAVEDLFGTFRGIVAETSSAWSNQVRRDTAAESLPATLALLLIAVVALAWGSRMVVRAEHRLGLNRSAQMQGMLHFLSTFLQLVVVFLGFVALQVAITQIGFQGRRGMLLVSQIGALGLLVGAAIWLGHSIFPRGDYGNEVLQLSRERRAEGRFLAMLLGLMMWGIAALRTLARGEAYSDATSAVIQFPVLVVGGLVLTRIGQLILRAPRDEAPAEEDAGPVPGNFRRGLARAVGRFVIVLGVLGPILGAVGYGAAARYLTFPAAVSLALIAFLVLLHSFLTALYGLLRNRNETQLRQELGPVLIGILLVVLSIPLFALIWGARVADLTEVWTRFTNGISMGDVRISPAIVVTFLVVFAAGYAVTRLIQSSLATTLLPRTKIDPGGQSAIVSGIGYIGIFLAGLLAITSTGISLSSLAFVAGALSLGIGFGLQNIVQNFVSGIILLVERPVAEGDWIEVGGTMGIVKDISVRATKIETFDKNFVIVPNADFISAPVTNWTRGNLTGRIVINIGVAYGSDTRHVEEILREIVEAHPLVTLNPPPNISFENFGADALEFVIRAILRDVNFGLVTRSEIRHEIARRFKEEGIEIPFGQRDIWLRNPERLVDAMEAGAARRAAAPSGGTHAPPNYANRPPDAATNPVEGSDDGTET